MVANGVSSRSPGRWPIVIVALGMALTLIWMAVLVWFFVTASGYAMGISTLVG